MRPSTAPEWELAEGSSCPEGCHSDGDLFDVLWLQKYKGEPFQMAVLRRYAADQDSWWSVSRMSDDEVVERVAKLLRQGVLHAHTGPVSGGGFMPPPPPPVPLGMYAPDVGRPAPDAGRPARFLARRLTMDRPNPSI